MANRSFWSLKRTGKVDRYRTNIAFQYEPEFESRLLRRHLKPVALLRSSLAAHLPSAYTTSRLLLF